MTTPTDGERAAFEAGIKCGALYHQFAGTPVTPESAGSLASAMADAIENQPFCTDVEVRPHPERIRRAIAGLDPLDDEADVPDVSADSGAGLGEAATDRADYTELTGTLYDATVVVERAGTTVRAELATEDDYPLLSLASVRRE